jgi:hypothetical protein
MAGMGNGSSMRVAALLLGLPLAACMTTGDEAAAPVAAATPAASAVASPPPMRSSGSGGGPRGGATTAAARAEPVAVEAGRDPLTQARADCWMMVEHKKEVRGIDQRIAFVDKCVAGQMKGKPKP